MPRADDLPMIETSDFVKACQTNPLGVKGGGESGTVGSIASAVNAVIDALSEFGVSDMKMPLTPLRVWEAIQGARVITMDERKKTTRYHRLQIISSKR